MPPTGFETAIPGCERSQNHALDRAANGVSDSNTVLSFNLFSVVTVYIYLQRVWRSTFGIHETDLLLIFIRNSHSSQIRLSACRKAGLVYWRTSLSLQSSLWSYKVGTGTSRVNSGPGTAVSVRTQTAGLCRSYLHGCRRITRKCHHLSNKVISANNVFFCLLTKASLLEAIFVSSVLSICQSSVVKWRGQTEQRVKRQIKLLSVGQVDPRTTWPPAATLLDLYLWC